MPRISRFSPNWSDPADLEAITVAREDSIGRAVDGVRESALTENKQHFLFVGPRGSGKTHLITLVRHRIVQMPDLAENLRIAWLNEDETSDSLLSLLLRTHRALARDYPDEFPADSIEAVFDLTDRTEATETITELLLGQLGDQTVLLLVENLDALFRDFDEGEQRRWRALIQNHPQFCTVATAQRLFHGVSNRDAPFFGFFQLEQLKPFTVAEATRLLAKIAGTRNDNDLASFVTSPHGRARIRALHHLTGGNQRLFIILSEFINRDSLDELVGPFEELVDEQLTPYYQERLRWLPTQQRRIVEFLCTASKPEPVKSIARQLFATSQTISSQLQDLRRIGYLESSKRGRESLYELAEPLMRLSHQVKEAKGRTPLRLLVDFLRVWYDHDELENRLNSVSGEESVTREYFNEAFALSQAEGNLRLQFLAEDAEGIDVTACDEEQLAALGDLMEESGDPVHALNYGLALGWSGQNKDAIRAFNSGLRLGTADPSVASRIHRNRGFAQSLLGDSQAAIADYTAVVEMENAPPDQVAKALYNRGYAQRQLGDSQAAIADYTAVVEMEDALPDQVAKALFNRGNTHSSLGDFEAAIADYTAVAEMTEAKPDRIAESLFNRGNTYARLGNSEGAIADYTAVVAMTEAPPAQIANALLNRSAAHARLGDSEAAIADCTAIVNMTDAPPEQIAKALVNRGNTHRRLGDSEAAIADYSAGLALDCEDPMPVSRAHIGMAHALMLRGDWEEAFRHLNVGISKIDDRENAYRGMPSAYINAIFNSGQSRESWGPKVGELISAYAGNDAIALLGTGLAGSLGALRGSPLSPEGLSAWHALWAEQAEHHPELALPARLLRTAIDYFTGGEDEATLLDLPAEERRILSQALGLEATESDREES